MNQLFFFPLQTILCTNFNNFGLKLSYKFRLALLLAFTFFFSNNVNAQYCVPTFTGPACTVGLLIYTFKVTGESGTSINDSATGCAFAGYDNRVTESVTFYP